MKRLNIGELFVPFAPNHGAGIASISVCVWSLVDGQVREVKGSKHIVHEGEEEAGSCLRFCALC